MDPSLQPLLARLDQLPDEFREVRDGVRRAVDIADRDPEMALTRVRKVLEFVVREVHERRVKEPPGTRPLENLLQRLVKDEHLPARVAAYANSVRELGNVGTHRFGEGVTADDVSRSLSQMGPILKWYFEAERPDAFAKNPGPRNPKERAEAGAGDEQERGQTVLPKVPSPGDLTTIDLGNGVEMKFAWCPPDTFLMGSPSSEEQREGYEGADETQHQVSLTNGYWFGVHAVTRGQFARFIQSADYRTEAEAGGGAYYYTGRKWRLDPAKNWQTPGFEQRDDHPVVCVSWNDTVAFCEWLAKQVGKGRSFRLPTEAEWEHACRGGTTTPFHFGETISTDQANYDGNHTYGRGRKGVYREKTTPVGNFPANAWGLFDMHGNVWEWCQDWYGPYQSEDKRDRQICNPGTPRVLRGGCWYDGPWLCRSACRRGLDPGNRGSRCGCRVLLCPD
jgi:formylglycine-generating enzyme required for sulfatase activity